MQKLGMEEGEAIEHKMISNAIEKAQKRVESHNFEIRKHLLEYDDVMNKQRQYVYYLRNQILEKDNIQEIVIDFFEDYIDEMVNFYLPEKKATEWDIDGLNNWLESSLNIKHTYNMDDAEKKSLDEMKQDVTDRISSEYQAKETSIGTENMRILERIIALQVIDQKWKEHLYSIDHIKEGVWTMGYAQKDPLVEYRFRSFEMFEEVVSTIKEDTINFLFKAHVQGPIEEQVPKESKQIGETIHRGTTTYGVNVAEMNDLQKASIGQPASTKPKSDSSEAAKKTAGGSSNRKSGRRKRS
jgi:preprotein translocase subunit SecA